MQISAQKAIEYGFVCDRNNNKITTDHSNKSSVDLSIREILFKDEKNNVRSLGRTLLKPQDSAFVISEEILHVPEGFIAYVFLKNRLSQKGFLALNTGIIDSEYNGPISTLLINFSAVEEYLPITDSDQDKSFFRVVFHEIEKNPNYQPTTPIPGSYNVTDKYNAYRAYRVTDITKFPKTFLEPIVLKEQISKELTEKLSSISIVKIGIVIAFVGAFLSLIPFGRDYYFAERFDLNEFNQYKLQSEKKIKDLEDQLDIIKARIDSKNNLVGSKKVNNR
ncbi:TPA: hypothetical protein ACPUGK_003788 [Klebsiella pneumoniae]|uniref:hypothetical protein n=1 Tax=Klebsiella pneumoniae TaxID=573 RepID=UPI003753D9DC|nr:hypothetical protein [Klebsiella pneumoniae]HBV6665479.1 hypothetical protein [Klebsiella pneumoniae]